MKCAVFGCSDQTFFYAMCKTLANKIEKFFDQPKMLNENSMKKFHPVVCEQILVLRKSCFGIGETPARLERLSKFSL